MRQHVVPTTKSKKRKYDNNRDHEESRMIPTARPTNTRLREPKKKKKKWESTAR
jgi:hypothetical protein